MGKAKRTRGRPAAARKRTRGRERRASVRTGSFPDFDGGGTAEEVASMGHLEPRQAVTVEVDAPALLAQAAEIAAAADGDAAPAQTDAKPIDGAAPAQGEPAPARAPAEVQAESAKLAPLVTMAVQTVANVVAPAWEVTGEECASVGAALADVLAHWFPNAGPDDPKWAALLGLAFAVAGVAAKRRTDDGWKPLRVDEKARTVPAVQAGRPVASVNDLAA
jgi:hypothetical protein